ncbi:hypothetical protein [Clostridium sp. AWRP]|uniref:hypothetical protein n=1 Tax=Clostridium sp. AWRP TaxID=2212991 RepID=UPI000FD8DCEB|nr:hypothetical protein [Clostridium sp. AWRP]AZV56430.1 hypothetical protein DMR38_07310 [Clostridium sp. AWRP]
MDNKDNGIKFLHRGAAKKEIVDRIDKNKFLGLNNPNTSRIDLFLFAMALGMDTTPTEVKQKETFIRDEYIKIKHDAFFYSAFIYKMEDKENFDAIKNIDNVYEFAEKYANTGFDLIDDMMKTKSESVSELELVKEMDQEYDKFFGK